MQNFPDYKMSQGVVACACNPMKGMAYIASADRGFEPGSRLSDGGVKGRSQT